VRPGYELPLIGQVAAGEPILAEENIDEYLEIPDVIGGEDGDYILQIRGESMKNAGILEGDYVVVRPSDDAGNGEIVVALIGEEATVKRIYREGRPHPAAARERRDGPDPDHRGQGAGRVVGFLGKSERRGRSGVVPGSRRDHVSRRNQAKAVDAGAARSERNGIA